MAAEPSSTVWDRCDEGKLYCSVNAILELSPAGYVFIDTPGKVVYVNPAFEQMTGISARALVGMTRDALAQALSALSDAPLTPDMLDAEAGITLQLQRPRFTMLRCLRRHLRDRAGQAHGYVLSFQDITREVEVDRLKSEFLSTAAHELRTPMASVLGFSELLLARQFPPDKQRDYIGIIHRQAGRLAAIINELLDLSRIDAMRGKDFHIAVHPLPALIHSVLDELLVPGDARTVRLTLPAVLPAVRVDPAKFHLALTNVLSNAYKYSFGKGEIELEVAAGEGSRSGWLGISVRDGGIGMTPEQQARVFERFWRADASGKVPGTGLGMALVKEIVGIFQGAVELESAPGVGTRVTIWLPAVTG